METALCRLNEKYGGVTGYLKDAGVSEETCRSCGTSSWRTRNTEIVPPDTASPSVHRRGMELSAGRLYPIFFLYFFIMSCRTMVMAAVTAPMMKVR